MGSEEPGTRVERGLDAGVEGRALVLPGVRQEGRPSWARRHPHLQKDGEPPRKARHMD